MSRSPAVPAHPAPAHPVAACRVHRRSAALGGLLCALALLAGAAPAVATVETPAVASTGGPPVLLSHSDPVSADQTGLTAVHPVRRVDTRPGASNVGGFAGRVDATVRSFVVTGSGVPTDATAVVVNIIAVDPLGAGFLTVWPAGTPQPLASTLNMVAHRTVTNNATVALGAGGAVSVAVGATSAYVVLDVQGYYAQASGAAFVPVIPTRVIDTRDGTGGPRRPLQPGETRDYTLSGLPTGTTGVVLNVTSTDPSVSGYLTIWAKGTARPATSNLNPRPGAAVPNLVTTGLTAGALSVYNGVGTVDVVVDVQGYLVTTGSGSFHPAAPHRTLDTRDGTGAPLARLAAGQTITVDVGGSGAGAVALNITGVSPTEATFLTVWPAGTTRPYASSVNLQRAQVAANAVLVPATDGRVSIYNSRGTLDVVVDTVGTFTGVARPSAAPAQASSVSIVPTAPVATAVPGGPAAPVVPVARAASPAVPPAPAASPALTTGPGDPNAYSITHYSDGSVIRWNPCTPVHWRANLAQAPAGALTDVQHAFALLSQGSGITFAYDGATSAVPQVSWKASWPAGQAPLVVAWAPAPGHAASSDLLPGGAVIGEGGWVARGGGGSPLQIVNGFVVLDTGYTGLGAGFGPTGRGQLLLHELMHSLGINHTTDKAQQMYPSVTGKAGVLGAGDLTGLRLVGRTAGCL